MKVLRKDEIVRNVRPGFPSVKAMVNLVFKVMNTAFVEQRPVVVNNFGRFEVVKQKRVVMNFKTKERRLYEGLRVKFYPSKNIQRIINEKNIINPL